MLTAERLRELLHYDPETGIFVNRVLRCRLAVGDMVGRPTRLGYLMASVDGKKYALHRLAWFYVTGYWPRELDHVDGLKSNNAFANLRECSRAQNIQSNWLTRANTSGFKGAFQRTGTTKWMSKIRVAGRLLSLGEFDTSRDAALAYDVAALKHFGAFARTNKMMGLL